MAPELVAGGGYGGLIREKPHCAILALNQADSCTEPWAGKSGSSGSDQILMNTIGTRSPPMLNASKQHFGSRKGGPWLARP